MYLINPAMNTFIFATDFSSNSLNALGYTLPLVKKLEGRLILFHGFEYARPFIEAPATNLPQMNQELKIKAEEQLKIWKNMVAAQDSTLSCEYVATGGPFVKNLLKLSQKEDAEAIFMGTHGASGLKKYIMGSNTASIIEKAKCPVFAIPEGVEFSGINSIVFATDYQKENAFILDELAKIARLFDAKVEVLHISNDQANADVEVYDWYKKAVKEKLSELDVSFRVFNTESVHEGINNYVKLNQTDLVVMAMHEKSWLERMLQKSKSKQQAYITEKPLLVFHHGVREKVLS
ncbi:MAG: universal stress protein [Bacteroidota bacterium]